VIILPSNIPYASGEETAGQKNLKNMNPPMVVLTFPGNLSPTHFLMWAKSARNCLGNKECYRWEDPKACVDEVNVLTVGKYPMC
jgi:hypothetical protein